jgi:AhpD family alkylhydroperoxidase
MRLPFAKIAPEPFAALLAVERYLESSGIERRLLHMIKLRASQLNGCAYCVDMHARDARLAGETERRLHSVAAFADSPLFDAREKAALAWADTLTRVAETGAPEAAWERLRAHFDEKQATDLTWAIASINAWNRVCIAFQSDLPAEWPKLP